MSNSAHNNIILAPGEGKIPLSILFDEYAEEASFCALSLGQLREFKTKITYKEQAKSALRLYNRNAARIDKLLYMYKKFELLSIADNVAICLRKKFTNMKNVTEEEILNDTYVDKLIQHDEGYKILEKLPTSPSYWEKRGKELKSMIRQLGMPTFFITFSSAETKWGELLVILKKVLVRH